MPAALCRSELEESIMGHRKSKGATIDADAVAGNGLLDRRAFLGGTAMAAATAGMTLPDSATADSLAVEPWMKTPGAAFVPYGQPSGYESKVVRTFTTA